MQKKKPEDKARGAIFYCTNRERTRIHRFARIDHHTFSMFVLRAALKACDDMEKKLKK